MADIIRSIVTRIDTTANWTTLNPTPASGEQCIEILGKGLFKLKVGDGVTPWISLQYEVLDKGFSQYRILLEREIKERIAADKALQDALNQEIARSTDKDDELDATVGALSVLVTDLQEHKVDQVEDPSVIYGTDKYGLQTTYNMDAFGNVDDVKVNGESVVDKETKIAEIDFNAETVEYTCSSRPAVENVKDALDDIMNKLYYENPSVTLTVSKAGDYDVGSVVKAPFDIGWNVSKQPTSADSEKIYLDNALHYDIIAHESNRWKTGSIKYNSNITSLVPRTYTFKINYTDNHSAVPSGGKNYAENAKSINFYYRRYYGTTTSSTLSDSQLYSLSFDRSNGRGQTRSFNCTGGKYWWIVIPTTYCSGIMFYDPDTGFEITLPSECITQRTITNPYGVSYSVNVYRSASIYKGDGVKVKVA